MTAFDVDILAFVDTQSDNSKCNYNDWKKARPILIASLGEQFIILPEVEIARCFDNWYREIQSHSKNVVTKTQLNILMAFSILNYFEKDLDRLKSTIDIVKTLLEDRNIEVARAASKVLCYLSNDIPDSVNLFKEIVENAFVWINQGKTKLYYNALLIIKRAKKFQNIDIVHEITNNISEIFPLSKSDDVKVRNLVANVISFVLKKLTPKNDPGHADYIYSSCIEDLCTFVSNVPEDFSYEDPKVILERINKQKRQNPLRYSEKYSEKYYYDNYYYERYSDKYYYDKYSYYYNDKTSHGTTKNNSGTTTTAPNDSTRITPAKHHDKIQERARSSEIPDKSNLEKSERTRERSLEILLDKPEKSADTFNSSPEFELENFSDNTPTKMRPAFPQRANLDLSARKSIHLVQAHGPLIIFMNLYKIRPLLFAEHLDVYATWLTELIFSQYELSSLASFDFINLITETDNIIFTNDSIDTIFDAYIDKCSSVCDPKPFFKRMINTIKIMTTKVPMQRIVDFIQKYILSQTNNLDKSLVSCAFEVFAKISEVFPGVSLPSSVYLNSPICKNYVNCLKSLPKIPPDVKQYLTYQMNRVLSSPSLFPPLLTNSLIIARTFQLQIFGSYDEMFKCVIQANENASEKILIKLVKTIACIPTREARLWLLNTAIYGIYKSVRSRAIESLDATPEISLNAEILLLSRDSCFRVRRRALLMMAKLMEYNPFDFSYPITEFICQALTTLRTTSKVKVAAKYASLMPIFAEYYINDISTLVPNIIMACLDLLCKEGDEQPQEENLTDSMSEKLGNVETCKIIYRDGFNDPDSFICTLDKLEKTEPRRTTIFKILNAKYFDKRDMFLLNTLAKLGNLVTPFLNRALTAFYKVFTTRRSNALLASAVNSLTLLSTKIDTGFNLRLHHQHFIPVLMKLLISAEGNEVSVAILKLFGTACDSVDTSEVEASAQNELGVDLKSKSFFTDFTISHLIPYFNTPSMQLFEAVTRIYDSAAKDAAKFVDLVIPMFIKGIESFNDKNRNVLFESLEVITRQCLSESTQFLPQLTQLQLKYINQINSIKLAASLSFHLLSGYITYASVLFLPATRMFHNQNRIYFKYLMKFLSFTIIFQDQSFESFLEAAEHNLAEIKKMNAVFINKLAKTVTVLVQSKDLSMYQSRLYLLACQMIETDRQINKNVIPLISSLVVCTHLPVSVIETWLRSKNIPHSFLDQLKGIPSHLSVIDVPYIKQLRPKFKLYHPLMPNTYTSKQFFLELTYPEELNIGKWLDDLCQRVISRSPSVVIRSCATLANTMSKFRQQLFPIAFLSCWQKASQNEQEHVSLIVKRVFSFQHVDPFFIQIIELLDRAFVPLQIDDYVLATTSSSRPLTLFFFQRIFKKDPNNHKIIEHLLDLNTTMGRHAAAHGMLVHAKGLLEDATAALWSEKLGEWDKALNLYANISDKDSYMGSIIRCYSHLEMWDKIKELETDFELWNPKLREETAKHFAWAYYHSDDFEKVDYYCSQFHKEQHLSEMLFWVFYLLRTHRYEECQTMITKGFDLLAKDTSVYIGGDAIRLHKNLHYSQMFIELQESLDILKRDNFNDIASDIWNKRLKGFKRDSESWIRLIAIRSLVFAPGEYINVYLKMISVLRKERRWNLIDTFFNRFFRQSIHPNVELEQSKILWARGKKNEAIEALKSVLDLIEIAESGSNEEFIENLNLLNPNRVLVLIGTLIKQPEFDLPVAQRILNSNDVVEALKPKTSLEHKSFLINICKESTDDMYDCFDGMMTSFDMDSNLESRIYRTLAAFKSASPDNSQESLEQVSHLYEIGKMKNCNDYKIWLGWAYANSRLIDAVPSNSDHYSVNAVQGFLKATQLRTSNTLEFLCQLFSIFFRVKDSKVITNTLISDLLDLPANIIVEIIPQITVQIAHNDELIRNVVTKILKKFGEKHFEALFYPLKLYESCDDAKKEIAHQLLLALGKNHSEVAEDANLFVDGMLRAAISWFEQWIVALDTASRANHHKNTKKMDKILKNQFYQYQHPMCDLDKLFIRTHDQLIQNCYNHFKEHTSKSIRLMWECFKHLFNLLNDRIKRLELILLPKVSEALATKRGFKIVVPGTYSVLHPVPTLYSIEPALQVLGTQQHPRCVFMNSSDGKKVKFLLKGNEDIRLDQRVMQFFTLINSLLNRTRNTRELGAQIVKYAIIPLSPNAGLITWVTGADTLHQMICERRTIHDTPQSLEFMLLDNYVGNVFQYLTSVQKLETFRDISAECDANEVREVLWARAPNAATWMTQNLNFTVTTALMSMVGYVIGLGDRHPSNIMVQRESGRVIHIDFGDSFESAILRESFPEKVPFRLTRMIVNALDSGTIEGIFRKTCEDVMWVLRESKASIVALLEIFIHEPLEDSDGQGKLNSQSDIIDRVAQKLVGRDELLHNYCQEKPEMDVETHVDSLVGEAADPSRYVNHYAGWCPFW
ncbi:hypothetical protein TRFO_14257 [Tritrichomonas foetus]|uniref:non-specific serine/threonine protein kinase n=1 Tax=Tritrichomonas foetus TaxID=1144522 RepID=A0A1J4KV89_9EUKA|nr:hypothetical protein TRFO_14257 [Tritrichomonas foetus]|eukprot:OHT15233.1 hypothetical protein TRFO_14257 [Tritrichomonas foetus]